jgi:hypothetical protein
MALRVTAPVNPLTGVTVIADVPVAPAKIVRLLGLVVSVKSWTATVTVTEWDTPPFVPVTVTV